MLPHLRFMPRWIIFFIDAFLCVNSIVLAYLLRFNFKTESIDNQIFINGVIASVVVYSFCFLIFRSYAGIVRHTNTQDTVKMWLASSLASFILYITNWIIEDVYNFLLIPASVILINYFITFFLLAGYRLLVKELFAFAPKVALKKDNIVIFGAGSLGMTTRRIIANERMNPWKVVAFVDDDTKKIQKELDGLKIYGTYQLPFLIKKFDVKQVIVAVSDLPISRRNEVIDICLENDVKASVIPSVDQWLNGTFRVNQIKNVRIEDLLERDPIQIHNEEIGLQLNNKRILITGAAGSIGSEMVRQIAHFNPRVLLLCDQAESPLNDLGLELSEKHVDLSFKLFIGSVTDKNRMKFLFENYKPDFVFHAAAYKHVPMMEEHPKQAVINNVLGTKIIADLSVEYGVEKFVMVSTDKAVNPTNIMGASKRLAEIYTQSFSNHLSLQPLEGSELKKTRFITTRFGNVLGSNGSVIPRFKTQIERGGPVTVTHPEITRYFMTIPEACQLVLEAGSMGKGGEVFVFDMGKSVKIIDMARKMIVLAGLKPDVDIAIEFSGLRPGEKLYEELLSNVEKAIPTYHQKIMIAKVREYVFPTICDDIEQLIETAKQENDWEIVRKMKQLIPEFVSNNSKFEKIDVELQSLREAEKIREKVEV